MAADLACGFLQYNDGRLYYEANGSGPALVFVHGFSLDRRMWRLQSEHFRGCFQVIAYDCRGFGRSSAPIAPYSHVDDLQHLLDYLGVGRAHLAGLSMGGRIAINFALAEPGRVQSLSLISADVGGYSFRIDWDPAGDTLEMMKASWLGHEIFAQARARPAIFAQLKEMVGDYSGFHWKGADPRWPSDTDAVSRLARIAAPTAVLVGGRDHPDFLAIAALLTSQIRQARLFVIAGAGHLAVMEQPTACNRLIESHVTASAP
ncbi:MAG: alpha/beta fold hydrolase [Streptosporangiaceae bacterium]